MHHSTSTDELDSAQQPQLKKYFITITLIIVLAIVFGQLYQDFHRKQEHLDSKRIHSHHQQAELVSELMNNLLLLREYDNMNAVLAETTTRKLLHNTKQTILTQDRLTIAFEERLLTHDNELLAAQERALAAYVDELILILNNVLVLVESDTISSDTIESQYQSILFKYNQFQDESERFVEKLSDYLEEESYEHRMILWGVVFIIIVLVIVVGFMFYRFVSGLVNRDFQLLAEDNLLRKKKEQESAEHAQLMFDQQMKMRSILDSTVDAIITITEDGNIDSFNKAAETMFGYPAEYIIGKSVKNLMMEPYASEHDDYFSHHAQTGDNSIFGQGREAVAKRVDGSEFPIYMSINEIKASEPKLFTGIIQDISRWKKSDTKLQQTMAELRGKQELLENEEVIARHVFENITASNNDSLPEISSWCEPMGTFSGDLMLSTLLPSGALRVILCDFTGHGLPAALGAVPVSSIHSAMAQKGLPLEILMEELNSKLNTLLPTGIFCCIAGIDIDATRTFARIWNAGLPDVIFIGKTGEIKQKIKSKHLPLGVADYQADEMHCEDIRLETGDAIYIYSDGITEAENQAGDMLGQANFEQILATEIDENGRLMDIRSTVNRFMDGTALTDDLSLIEVKTLVTMEDITLES